MFTKPSTTPNLKYPLDYRANNQNTWYDPFIFPISYEVHHHTAKPHHRQHIYTAIQPVIQHVQLLQELSNGCIILFPMDIEGSYSAIFEHLKTQNIRYRVCSGYAPVAEAAAQTEPDATLTETLDTTHTETQTNPTPLTFTKISQTHLNHAHQTMQTDDPPIIADSPLSPPPASEPGTETQLVSQPGTETHSRYTQTRSRRKKPAPKSKKSPTPNTNTTETRTRTPSHTTLITQCFNCLRLNYSAASCSEAQRCNRCGGPHRHTECTVPRSQPRCANCQGSHAASFPGCPFLKRAIRDHYRHARHLQAHHNTPQTPLRQDTLHHSNPGPPTNAYMSQPCQTSHALISLLTQLIAIQNQPLLPTMPAKQLILN